MSCTGPIASPSSAHATIAAKTTSESPRKEESLVPSIRMAWIPATYANAVEIAPTMSTSTHQGVVPPKKSTFVNSTSNGTSPARAEAPSTRHPMRHPAAARAIGGTPRSARSPST
jgi:hypothetical protein